MGVFQCDVFQNNVFQGPCDVAAVADQHGAMYILQREWRAAQKRRHAREAEQREEHRARLNELDKLYRKIHGEIVDEPAAEHAPVPVRLPPETPIPMDLGLARMLQGLLPGPLQRMAGALGRAIEPPPPPPPDPAIAEAAEAQQEFGPYEQAIDVPGDILDTAPPLEDDGILDGPEPDIEQDRTYRKIKRWLQ